jgi:hypothetical protein
MAVYILLFTFFGVPLLGWLSASVAMMLKGGWGIVFGALSILGEVTLILAGRAFLNALFASSMSVPPI